jgi:uncharacterized protein (PEP-CTERM system associated)
MGMAMGTGMTMKSRRPDRRPQQQSRPAALRQGAAAAALLGALAQQAQAQSAGVAIQPRLSVSQTWTDNLQLTTQNRDAAVISTIAPGINLSVNSGRVRGALDYSLNGLIYSKTDRPNRIQNALSAKGAAELVDNWIYLDAAASISQQVVSAFGSTSSDSSLQGGNTSEVASISMSPSVKGQFARVMAYALIGNVAESRAKDSESGDSSSRALSLNLNGLGSGRLLNWSAALSKQESQARGSRDTNTSSATATLLVNPDVDWNFGLTAGFERNDYTALSGQDSSTYGANLNWTPTPRTKMAASWSYHEYGNAHSLNLEHRMARSVWRLSDSQSVNTPGTQGRMGQMSNYDLFYIQFAAEEPDPVQRDILVRAYLSRLGLSPDAMTTTGFLSASASLTRNQSASVSLQGQRTTVTFMLSQSKSRRVDSLTTAQDDLSESTLVLQRGFTVNIAHRLTPTSSASLSLSQQQSRGDQASQSTDLTSISANWNHRLGSKTSMQLGVRHNRFSSPQRPYRENALLATVVQQF